MLSEALAITGTIFDRFVQSRNAGLTRKQLLTLCLVECRVNSDLLDFTQKDSGDEVTTDDYLLIAGALESRALERLVVETSGNEGALRAEIDGELPGGLKIRNLYSRVIVLQKLAAVKPEFALGGIDLPKRISNLRADYRALFKTVADSLPEGAISAHAAPGS